MTSGVDEKSACDSLLTVVEKRASRNQYNLTALSRLFVIVLFQ